MVTVCATEPVGCGHWRWEGRLSAKSGIFRFTKRGGAPRRRRGKGMARRNHSVALDARASGDHFAEAGRVSFGIPGFDAQLRVRPGRRRSEQLDPDLKLGRARGTGPGQL